MLNLYITSANRNDGKTLLSAGLAATMQSLGYKTSVYKPIQTGGKELNGFMQSPDLTFIKTKIKIIISVVLLAVSIGIMFI